MPAPREHFATHGFTSVPFAVASRATYALDELLGTKLRALYQRKKGRDLFDLATALALPDVAGWGLSIKLREPEVADRRHALTPIGIQARPAAQAVE